MKKELISKAAIERYNKARVKLEAAKAAEAEAKAALVAVLETAGVEALDVHGYTVSNKHFTTTRIDSKRLAVEQPEIAAAYTVAVASSRFNVKASK